VRLPAEKATREFVDWAEDEGRTAGDFRGKVTTTVETLRQFLQNESSELEANMAHFERDKAELEEASKSSRLDLIKSINDLKLEWEEEI